MTATDRDPFDALSGLPFDPWRCLGAPKRLVFDIAPDAPSVDGSTPDKPRPRPLRVDEARYAPPGSPSHAPIDHGGYVVRVDACLSTGFAGRLISPGRTFLDVVYPDELAHARAKMIASPAEIEVWRAAERTWERLAFQFLFTANGEKMDRAHPGYPAANGITLEHFGNSVSGVIEQETRGGSNKIPPYHLREFLAIEIVRELPKPVTTQSTALAAMSANADALALNREMLAAIIEQNRINAELLKLAREEKRNK